MRKYMNWKSFWGGFKAEIYDKNHKLNLKQIQNHPTVLSSRNWNERNQKETLYNQH